MKVLVVLLALTLVFGSFGSIAFSQEQAKEPAKEQAKEPAKEQAQVQEPAVETETDYIYGKVASIAGDAITVQEITYDGTTGEEITKTEVYNVTPDTALDNVASAQEIKPGAEIEIEFVEKEGKKQATYIYVYTGEEGEV